MALIQGRTTRAGTTAIAHVAARFSGHGALSALGQLMQAASFLVAARFVAPPDLLLFTQVTVLQAAAGAITAGRLDVRIVSVRSENEVAGLFGAGLLFTSCIALAVSLYLGSIGVFVGSASSQTASGMVTFAVFLASGLVLLAQSLALRQGAFIALGAGKIVQGIIVAMGQLSAIILDLGSNGLLLSIVLGQSVAALYLLQAADLSIFKIRVGQSIRTIWYEKGFVLPTLGSAVANTLGNLNGISFFAAALFRPETSGLLFFALRTLSFPVVVIGPVLAQWCLKTFADRVNAELPVRSALILIVGSALLGSMIVYLPVMVFGPALFSLVFGETWAGAGETAAVLAVAFTLQLALAPSAQLWLTRGRADLHLLWDLGRLALVACALAFSISYGASDTILLWFFVGAQSLAYGVLFIAVWRSAP